MIVEKSAEKPIRIHRSIQTTSLDSHEHHEHHEHHHDLHEHGHGHDHKAPKLPQIDLPQVIVNGQEISAAAIARQMQYHPANSAEEASILAARTLALEALVQQRAKQINLLNADADAEDTEAVLDQLLKHEGQLPSLQEEDIQRYYASNPRQFTTAPLIAARHILLAADPRDADQEHEQSQKAQALLAELAKEPMLFSTMVKEHSDCPSAKNGGELGQVSKGQTVPEFEQALFRLPEGIAPQPLRSRYGFHIVDIQKRCEGALLPLEVVRERLTSDLEQRLWQKAAAQYLQVLINDAEIEGIDLVPSSSPLLQ